jgi:hypothetical protein
MQFRSSAIMVVLAFSASGLVAAGCSSTPKKSASSPSTTSTTVAAPTTSTTTLVPLTPTTTPTPILQACTSNHLAATVDDGEGAAGTEFNQLILTNTGTTQCTLQGYPGLAFVGANGVQLGAAAARDSSLGTPASPQSPPSPLNSLEPGQSSFATFTYGGGGPCATAPAATPSSVGLRVYPPGQTAALFAPFAGAQPCSSDPNLGLTIMPFGVKTSG